MDRRQFFGESVAGTLIRLAVLCIVVGVILSALDITPYNLVDRLVHLVRRVYDLGFGALTSVLRYFVLGALVVIPIWVITRVMRGRGDARD